MTIDIERVRAETPGAAAVVHFNNAGAALPPQPVTDAVIQHLQLEALIGGYEAADSAYGRIKNAYAGIATLLNCHVDEVAIVENATRAWDMAFYGLPFGPGDRILTARSEYASNYIAFLQVAKRTGAVIEVVPNDAYGQISIDSLERMIDRRVKLIAITHIPTNGGLVNPAAEIGRIAKAAGIPYLLDACQSVGQMPIDVEAIGCDMLAATGRKFLRGPRGTGFLYVRRSMIEKIEPPLLDLHAAIWTGVESYTIRPDARRFENWEFNVAAKIGLGVAVEYALEIGLEPIRERIWSLATRLRNGLSEIGAVTVQDLGVEKCGIVSFSAAGVTPPAIRASLRSRGVNVSVTTTPSTRLDMEERGLDSLVRASVHYYNTEQEVDRCIGAVREMLRRD